MLRYLFFLGFVRPLVYIILGVNIRNRERLPKAGPAILIANHNSHLDTLVLMSLFPSKIISNVHPVAAADYWLSNRLIAWFAKNIVGIIPIERRSPAKTSGEKTSGNPMENISEALLQNKILIFFPEGSRGEAEQMTHFKSGIARISEKHPDVPITPIYLHGLGKCLPKGEGVLVPFICDVFVGNSLCWTGDRIGFVPSLEQTLNGLSKNAHRAGWE